MLKLVFTIFVFFPGVALGATIYVDGSLGANCTSGNYSIASRNCTGNGGNAYNNIQAALTASAANDTIYFRSGAITVNITGIHGIFVKTGQTWAQYPGDTARSTTITADATNNRVFTVYNVSDVTIRDLTIVGGRLYGIFSATATRTKIINNEVRGFNHTADSGNGGIGIVSFDTTHNINNEVTDNYIHSPVQTATDHAGVIVVGNNNRSTYVSGTYIARNRIEDVRFGVWLDVHACAAQDGATAPCLIEHNYIKNTEKYCMHNEEGSTGVWRRNICDSPRTAGWLMRPNNNTWQNRDILVYNNTIYNPNRSNGSLGIGIWIQNDTATANVQGLKIQNNIVYRSGGGSPGPFLLSVGELEVSDTTNRYQNNLFHVVGSTQAICWGNQHSFTAPGCTGSPGTIYDDTASGMAAWAAAAPSGTVSGNITGDPLFANPAGEDFRLCTGAGQPVPSCTGKSPAIDAGANVGLSFQGLAPDIGAIESGPSTGGPPLAPTIISLTP